MRVNFLSQAKPSQAKHAFTLVELSIVIVIIGLIIAGVTAGQTMVKQTRLRAVVTDVNNYKTAYNTFKLQYNAVPGDMINASSFFTGSTNGNGNGTINDTPNFEELKAWDHLAKAALINGVYTGALSGGIYVIKVNAPPGSIPNSTYAILSQYGAGAIYGKGANINGIRFGAVYGTSNNGGIISGVDASSIDAKIDDGKASLGSVVSAISTFGSVDGVRCVTGSHTGAAGSSDYIMTDNGKNSCVMEFWIGR